LKEIDKVEITTLQDNYIDLLASDGSEVVQRAIPLKGMEVRNSILAEHGFSALVTVTSDGSRRDMMFDFGFSAQGAAFNADALNLDLSSVEVVALSHGHLDHTGGFAALLEKIGRKEIELYLHPAAFKAPRYLKISDELKLRFPAFTREQVDRAGVRAVETIEPHPLLGGSVLFLGEIPRQTPFEKVPPNFCCEKDGQEKPDPIEDDTALAFNVRGKGLVVLSGCAHSGIINTVKHAQRVSEVNPVFAVMGGYHLTGADLDAVIAPTADALRELNPQYIVPTHCTGRIAADYMQKQMPDRFLLNMSGTKMTFSA
jgi:7,8-dihydropterin-6-yl-methyl-4-(beta-D-ribofuranosyl)aminobenzene 5'-phosphate synthase